MDELACELGSVTPLPRDLRPLPRIRSDLLFTSPEHNWLAEIWASRAAASIWIVRVKLERHFIACILQLLPSPPDRVGQALIGPVKAATVLL
jgi:hypothetical protein